jgi:hypothetical protein
MDRIRAARVLVVATVLASSTYFFTGGGWNQAAHFDLVRALVETRSIRIDFYHRNTGDKSEHEGHYYSNKAPGLPFLAAPVAGATRIVQSALGANPSHDASLLWQARLATFFCASLPVALAAWVVLETALRWGAGLYGALWGALVFGVGSPAWIQASIFWAHPLAMGCLAAAFLAALALDDREDRGRDVALASSVGGCAGWAVLTEYQAAGPAVILAVLAAWKASASGRGRLLRVGLGVLAGAAPPALLLFSYQAAAFGSPWKISYAYTQGFEGVNVGWLGVTYPRGEALLELLFGNHRGLLSASPVLILGFVGWGLLLRHRRPMRAQVLAAAGIFLFYLLFAASLHNWRGGWAFGPRYMIAALPFLALGLAPVWDISGRHLRGFLAGLSLVGVLFTIAVLATHPFPSQAMKSPLFERALPDFFTGTLSRNGGALVSTAPLRAFNLGESIGLKGLASLVPLVILWGALGFLWFGADCAALRAAVGNPTAQSPLGEFQGPLHEPPAPRHDVAQDAERDQEESDQDPRAAHDDGLKVRAAGNTAGNEKEQVTPPQGDPERQERQG